MEITVIKRDGEKEPFDEKKISQVLKAAGLDEEKARIIASNTKKKILEEEKHEVTSLQVRDLLIPQIQEADESTANAFIWYEKTKD